MKKTLIAPLITAIVFLLIGASLVYFFISLNRMDKRVKIVQQSVIDSSTKVGAVVNFLNASTNAQNNR